MEAGNPGDDIFIDWLLRAYVGTSEIHDLTSKDRALSGTRCLVAVSDSLPLKSPGLLLRHELPGPFFLLVLSSAIWEQVRAGQAPLPDGFERVPTRSWSRRPEHGDTTTQVEQLSLTNFRCFEQAVFSFEAGANVLIGRNGAGKTAILDALATGLAGMIRPLHPGAADAFSERMLQVRDVRVARIEKGETTTFEPQLPARIDANLPFLGRLLQAGSQASQHDGGSIFTGTGRAIPFLELADVVRWAVQDGFDVTLPLVAYYGTGRTWRGGPERPSTPENLSRLAGYEGCLSPSTQLAGMRAWFRRMELLALQDSRAPAVLEASKSAILACLEGFDLVRYDARLDDLAARFATTGLLLGFEQLSDGQRNMLGMVADMAYRASTLNPHLGADAAANTPGVVLIDEVDLHLHPAWQRRVLTDLTRAFPRIQFVVTTHSPQVLSTAPAGSVRLIDAEHKERRVGSTAGKDSNALLEDILDVPARPQEVKNKLEELARKIDDGQFEEAKTLLEELSGILGADDSQVVAARWELSLAEGGDAEN